MTDKTYCIDASGLVICALGDPRAVAVLQFQDTAEQYAVESAIAAGAVIDEGSFKTDWDAVNAKAAAAGKAAAAQAVAEWHAAQAAALSGSTPAPEPAKKKGK